MAQYLVSGAAGFIGARVAGMLLDEGHTVVGVDNLNDAYDVRMKQYRLAQLLGRTGFIFLQSDIGEQAIIETLVKAAPARRGAPLYDAVINLAARAGVRQSVTNPWVYVQTNMTGTLNLLELARQHGIPKFILASTSSIYGADAPLPTGEDANSDRPLQPYAASKKGAEAMCHAYHFLHGIDVTVVRYFTVYGPAGRPDMVMLRFVKWISEGETVRLNGDGEQSRGFTYVDDIARGTLLALKPVGYEIVNLGGHESITIKALIERMETLIGKHARVEYLPFPKADMVANLANVSKARRLLGWEPRVPLSEGLRMLVEWYQAEREWVSQVQMD